MSPTAQKQPKIIVSKFGKIADQQIDHILQIVEECYSRLEPHDVALVDLYVFEQSSSMDAFMTKESMKVGVVSSSFNELFFAMHDAYRGTSRIILCLERMKKLPTLVQAGGIRHEVGHSVLHGSLVYYLLPLPPALLSLIRSFNNSRELATDLFYLMSIAVKDYEVSRLLKERGYVEDQVTYAKHLLRVTESDKRSWEISRGRPPAEVLCLVSWLKAAACAAPFMFDKTFGEEMKQLLEESLFYLPKDYSTRLRSMILRDFQSLGTDTLSNINHVAHLTTENIIKPILLRAH